MHSVLWVIACGPIAISALHEIAKMSSKYPKAANIILKESYVNDLIDSGKTVRKRGGGMKQPVRFSIKQDAKQIIALFQVIVT